MTAQNLLRILRGFLTVLGIIAIVAGAATVVAGVDSIVGAEEVSATVDSEMRFYAAWYVGAGALFVWAAQNLESAGTIVRGAAAALFLGGVARVLSWAMVGKPHNVAVVLMVIELTLPWLIVAWYRIATREGQ